MSTLIAIFLFCIGAVVASFLALVAERMHTGISWMNGRSRCNACNRPLSTIDLLPVASWFFFRGKCRTCGASVPALYTIVEALTGTVFVLGYSALGISVSLALFLVSVALLVLIVLYDLRHTIILLPVLWCFVGITLLFALLQGNLHSFGLTLVYGSLCAFFLFGLHVFSKGRAMGLGDVPLTFALSCIAGEYAVSGLLFSFWIGAVLSVALLVFGRTRTTMKTEVPFAPFLALGYLLAFFLQWNPFLIPLL